MTRDRSKDNELFRCAISHEVEYVSELYENKKTVLAFLFNKCDGHQIFYSTFLEIYEMIEKELGFPIPD